MLMLVASADGTLTAAAARAKGRPVVLAQGGIHAGEIDGKDAGFLALRELLEGRVSPGVLGRVTLVFVPVFNVDGHERVSRTNRPNQIGPRGGRLARHQPEPEPQSRLREGRRARDAGDAAPAERVGSDRLRRPARHRRRAVRARRVAQRGADAGRRRGAAAGRRRPARRPDAAAGGAGLAAARLLSVVHPGRRSGVRLRGDGRSAALLAGILGRAAAHRRAGRDALVEAVSGPRPGHAQRHRRPARSRRRRRRRVARGGAIGGSPRRRPRRHQRAAPLPGDRPRPAARVPRLRVSPRDVADLGRHRDALRPVDAADLARAAPRRGEADGEPSTRRAAATSCPRAMPPGWRRSWRCTASRAGRSPRRCRVSPSRRSARRR